MDQNHSKINRKSRENRTVAADLGVLPDEVVVALVQGVPGCAEVPEAPLAHDAGVVAGHLQRAGNSDVGRQEWRVGAVIPADRGVPEVLAKHQHGAARRAHLPAVTAAELHAVLGHTRHVRLPGATTRR